MEKKSIHIHTIGCQMNVYDSERIASLMRSEGYEAAGGIENADLVVINTCTIRAKAEQKVYSLLGRLSAIKRKRPGLIIAVGGCIAQQEGRAMINRVPAVDIVFGTHAVGRFPRLMRQVERTGRRLVDIDMQDVIDEIGCAGKFQANRPVSAFVTIMQGCDNFCTYCVVPYVRGREMSRTPEAVLDEVRFLVSEGVREVTLLGQNVNSYGQKENYPAFSELLARVNQVDGLKRIRFTTSHPKDLSDQLIDSFQKLDKLCSHIHLPVQSGSDRILKRMNRRYTRDDYLRKVEKLRRAVPDIAITSDFIVGFPGETEDDFQQSLQLIREVEYDSLFAFQYSDRPNAPAAKFSEKLDESQISDRLQDLLALQEKNTYEKNKKLVGAVQPVLVEGYSKKGGDSDSEVPAQWTGRTSSHKIVNFTPNMDENSRYEDLTGKMVNLIIEKAFSHSLIGRIEPSGTIPLGSKGENNYAA